MASIAGAFLNDMFKSDKATKTVSKAKTKTKKAEKAPAIIAKKKPKTRERTQFTATSMNNCAHAAGVLRMTRTSLLPALSARAQRLVAKMVRGTLAFTLSSGRTTITLTDFNDWLTSIGESHISLGDAN
jgi:uncharacterized membrane protein YcjF (UPF0283 family)